MRVLTIRSVSYCLKPAFHSENWPNSQQLGDSVSSPKNNPVDESAVCKARNRNASSKKIHTVEVVTASYYFSTGRLLVGTLRNNIYVAAKLRKIIRQNEQSSRAAAKCIGHNDI